MANLLTIDNKTIDLWVCEPNSIVDTTLLSKYQKLLTQEETIKQQRYKFAKDRHDALITRAFVRDLLSRYQPCKPHEWRFSIKDKGKPEIASPDSSLKFNLSHTKGLIICAVTQDHEIGCDVENLSRDNAIIDIADRYFSSQEVQALHKLTTHEQIDRFYDLWTLKESFIKSIGLGLAIPLKDFSFTINPKKNPAFNDNIALSLSAKMNDDPRYWRSWLFYPSKQHRIAISIRTDKDIQAENYRFRFFQSTPLTHHQSIDLMAMNSG